VEPVRVKLYGLFSLTRRRYLIQTLALELPAAAVTFIGWYFALRPWCDYYHKHPPAQAAQFLSVYLSIFDNLPWILLAALAYKALEVWIVLRIFARKEAQVAKKKQAGDPGA
jgi:hypothetical protein